jgi:soluble lytic murein transglycosylase-like protein
VQADIQAHVALSEQRCATISECRSQIAQLRLAIEWQKGRYRLVMHRQLVHFRRDSRYAIALAARAFGLSEWGMGKVASCESHLNPWARNPTSGAAGLMQFLPKTWQHTPFASFSVFDPLPNALAAAQIVHHDRGYGQWSCRP